MKPLVVIIGKPNVGKSTLFNRLVGKRQAITLEVPGTTRDRLYADVESFILADTAGLSFLEKIDGSDAVKMLNRDIQKQIAIALESADLILFVLDVKSGITSADIEAARQIRKSGKRVLIIVNKCDPPLISNKYELDDFYQLGLGDPFCVSALHGTKSGDLLETIENLLPPAPKEEVIKGTSVAIVGRPNVGKSTLFNALIGEERAIVSDIPGTTRDIIDTKIVKAGQTYILKDTAGLRRRTAVRAGIERYSVARTIRAINQSDIVLFVFDATDKIARQDIHVLSYAVESSKSIILIVNKIDLFDNSDGWIVHLRSKISFLPWAPVIFNSAKLNLNINIIYEQLAHLSKERDHLIESDQLVGYLNNFLNGRTKVKIKEIIQTTNPILFELVNTGRLEGRFFKPLEKEVRKFHEFAGTPISIVERVRSNRER